MLEGAEEAKQDPQYILVSYYLTMIKKNAKDNCECLV